MDGLDGSSGARSGSSLAGLGLPASAIGDSPLRVVRTAPTKR
jgi:hypothetical protein